MPWPLRDEEVYDSSTGSFLLDKFRLAEQKRQVCARSEMTKIVSFNEIVPDRGPFTSIACYLPGRIFAMVEQTSRTRLRCVSIAQCQPHDQVPPPGRSQCEVDLRYWEMSDFLSVKTELQLIKLMSRTILSLFPARCPAQIGTPQSKIETVYRSRFCSSLLVMFHVGIMIQTDKT